MEYSIKELGDLAGISTRTLRFYDEIGLLKPLKINSSGYRIYGEEEVNTLQQILFYRELDISLKDIKTIITSEGFDALRALKEHKQKLLDKRTQLELLIKNVDKSIALKEGRTKMSNKEKFQGFKKELIEKNEKNYGKEMKERYGEENVKKYNEKFLNLTEEDYHKMEELSAKILEKLKEAYATEDPSSEEAQTLAAMHKEWLTFTWPSYSKEAHRGLAEMYVADERFKEHYDKVQEGGAEFLRDAIFEYTK